MTTLRLEHPISSFEVWKSAFDADPIRREPSGVRSYRVFRPVDDPNYVAVDLDFDGPAEAARFHDLLRDLWRSREAVPALAGTPTVRIVETVESVTY